MKLTIKGTYRSRLYINLIFFKIARGWKEEKFERSVDIEALNTPQEMTFRIAGDLSCEISQQPYGPNAGAWDAHLMYGKQDIFKASLGRLAFPKSIPFKLQPLKGVILEGTIAVEA